MQLCNRVARKVPRDRPWPPLDGRCAEAARRQLADITEDPRLLEALAKEVHVGAERRWEELRAAGSVTR